MSSTVNPSGATSSAVAPSPYRPSVWPAVFAAAGLIVLVLLAFWPLLFAGFIWDDQWITANYFVQHWSGLWYIWRGYVQGVADQYYPLTYTFFILQYKLWGASALGYHLCNIVLQAANAILLWRILKRLELKCAWLIAAIWAIHPVTVETISWVAEQKNLWSALFYFAAVLAWLRFVHHSTGIYRSTGLQPGELEQTGSGALAQRGGATEAPPRRFTGLKPGVIPGVSRMAWYFLALVFFVLAMFAKTVACTLPVVLLLVLWWKRGRLTWRDLVVHIPWFLVAWRMAGVTVGLENSGGGSLMGSVLHFTLGQRLLIAGKDLWFYPLKVFWPRPLLEIYPRWHVSTLGGWQWLYPLTALAVPAALLLLHRKIGRGPFAAVAFYGLTIAPALGLISWGFLIRSFVADHLQYMACLGLIALAVEGFWFLISSFWLKGHFPMSQSGTRNQKPETLEPIIAPALSSPRPRVAVSPCPDDARRLSSVMAGIGGGAVLAVLGSLTWAQSWVYMPPVHVWTHDLKYNPTCTVALENVARDGRFPNMVARGIALLRREVRRTHGADPLIDADLADAYFAAGDYAKARVYYQRTLQADPSYLHAMAQIVACDEHLGRGRRVLADLRRGLKTFPQSINLHQHFADALEAKHHYRAAARQYRIVIPAKPCDATPLYGLALALENLEQWHAALIYYHQAVHYAPDWPMARFAYGRCLLEAGQAAAAVEQFRRVIQLLPPEPVTHRVMAYQMLAQALTALGRHQEAAAAKARAVILQNVELPTATHPAP